MAPPIYRRLYFRFWDDPSVFAMPPIQKLIANYLLTSPQTNRCGLYVFSVAQAAEHLGLELTPCQLGVGLVCHTLEWGVHEPTRTLWIPSWWKWNHPHNRDHLIGCLSDLEQVPDTPLITRFYQHIQYLDQKLHEPLREYGRHRVAHLDDMVWDTKPTSESEAGTEAEAEAEEKTNTPSQPSAATARFCQANFDKFWQTYKATGANRGSKARAIDQWRKALTNGLDPTTAITCLEWQIACRRDRQANGEWVEQFKHAERWLRHGLYKQPDYFEVAKPAEAPIEHFRADDFERTLAGQETAQIGVSTGQHVRNHGRDNE